MDFIIVSTIVHSPSPHYFMTISGQPAASGWAAKAVRAMSGNQESSRFCEHIA